MATMRSAFGYGNGRSKTVLTTLKMAELAPMPTASVTTTIAVKPGCLSKPRRPWRMSFRIVSMISLPLPTFLFLLSIGLEAGIARWFNLRFLTATLISFDLETAGNARL